MFPFRACCSWLRFFRGRAQTTRTGSVPGDTDLQNQNFGTEISHKASKETWSEKNQLRVKKKKQTNRQN